MASFQHTFRTCPGREVMLEEIYPYFGEPLRVTMLRFAPEQVELLAVYRSFNQEQHDRLARPFPGAVDTVRAAK